MNGHPARSLWSGHQLTCHINCLEMLAVFQAFFEFLPDPRDRHVLVHTDNTSVVSYINHQGGLRSHPLYKLAHQILVWSQDKLLLLRAVYVPGHLNLGADILSRQGLRPGECMLHPEVVKQIWRVFGPAQVDLFATRENTQCPLWCSLVHPAPLGLDAMVQTWPRLPDRSAPGSSRESAPGRGIPSSGSPVLSGPSMVLGPDFYPRRLSLGDPRQERSPLTGRGFHSSTPAGAVEAVGVASEGAHPLASGLSTEQDPVNCPVGSVLEFLQDRLSAGLSHSTIAAYHAPLGDLSVGKNPLVTQFLHGALRPPRVGDLQALSVAPSFLDFTPGLSKAFLYPRLGYVPKVPSSTQRPVVLQAFCPPPFRDPDFLSVMAPLTDFLSVMAPYEFS
ncbi:Filamin-A-interacting protein 1 [Labeo rohita]|uniref:Filamin-A-interacting protein 1 n=1 Tax=Labeo rohita TaxID=84645 RepID=A0ABQ8L8J8_LABRO|nr:Filamin-A-interacting protein 1 [Labeo rohita]